MARPEVARLSTEMLDSLHDATQAVFARVVPDLGAEGLTSCTFWTLYRLGPGGADHPGAVARELGVTMPSVTQKVDQLVEAGFVSRRRSETDRRVVKLRITPTGRRVLGRVVKRIDASLSTALEEMPRSDVRTATHVLRALAARLRGPAPDLPRGEAA